MKKGDKKWLIVFFDIPELYRRARESLVISLKKQAGFYPLQESVLFIRFQNGYVNILVIKKHGEVVFSDRKVKIYFVVLRAFSNKF